MSSAGTIEVVAGEAAAGAGLDALIAEAWTESGRKGGAPPGWRPWSEFQTATLAARTVGTEGLRLEGYAAVRPAEGMDAIEFFYVRSRARGGEGRVQAALLERAVAQLKATGLTRIIYAGFGWWRRAFPDDLARGFLRAGFGRFEGVFLARLLDDPPPEPVLPLGYSAGDWDDRRFEEVCALMLRTPEPGALYWDIGLCRRSILNAANPTPPLFRDGFGQLIYREGPGGEKRVVAFSLVTSGGYVNHVYCDPAEHGRGLGRAALVRVLRALARKGVGRATILTHDTNPRALSVYERLGFRVDFRFPQFWLKW